MFSLCFLDLAAGCSDDYAYGAANATYSYCMELRDTGKYGFLLPPNQIKPSGAEAFAAIRKMTQVIAEENGIDLGWKQILKV